LASLAKVVGRSEGDADRRLGVRFRDLVDRIQPELACDDDAIDKVPVNERGRDIPAAAFLGSIGKHLQIRFLLRRPILPERRLVMSRMSATQP
jgi:hypothetical protein